MHLLVNTSGGDAPGLNAVIRAVVLAATTRRWKVTGIRNGYEGLLMDPAEGLVPLTRASVRGITHLGGTILGTRNKGHPFEYPVVENGKTVIKDISPLVVERFKATGADALVVIGGDGSLRIGQQFFEMGIPIVGVPKTIDNDICGTFPSFGFDTAVMIATEAIDRLHTTAESHERVMVVEVMGRYAGWIALYAGIAGSADVILLPEIDYDIEKVCDKIRAREKAGIRFSIVVTAEGAKPKGGKYSTVEAEEGHLEKLGGISEKVAKDIADRTGKETRFLVLGHLQRGGGPTHRDRLLALRYGTAAVSLVEKGEFGKMVAFQPPVMTAIPIKEAIKTMKTVSPDSDLIKTGIDLGISFGN